MVVCVCLRVCVPRGSKRKKEFEEEMREEGDILEPAPVIISVSRHRGSWTANAHVSPRSLAVTR